MFKHVSKLILTSNKNIIPTRLITTYPKEIISVNDQKLFPPENGVLKRSHYGVDLNLTQCTIDQFVWKDMDQWADKTAVICGITGKSHTYASLRDHCSVFAYKLRHLFNMEQGEVVGLCM